MSDEPRNLARKSKPRETPETGDWYNDDDALANAIANVSNWWMESPRELARKLISRRRYREIGKNSLWLIHVQTWACSCGSTFRDEDKATDHVNNCKARPL